jgi:hypothetical protein
VEWTIGQRTWLSHGQTTENFGGPGAVPDVLSELTWLTVDSTVVEFNTEAVVGNKLVLTMDFGFGAIEDGRLLDQDFLLSGRDGLFSSSLHPVPNDDLFYFNFDMGYRLMSRRDRCGRIVGHLDVLTGYQYWRERYVAIDGSVVDVGGTSSILLPAIPVITHEYEWSSWRLGVRSQIELAPRLSLRSRLIVVPVTGLDFDDIHHLRTDLRQDPSFYARTTGGWGVMVDATLSFRVLSGLSIEAGYQVYDITGDNGTIIAQAVTGDVAEAFNEAETTRHGIIAGVRWQF